MLRADTRKPAPVESDAHGKYSISWQARRPMTRAPLLMARSLESNLVTVHTLDETTTHLDLRLEEGLTVTAKVQDAKGRPIPIAIAVLRGFSGRNTRNAATLIPTNPPSYGLSGFSAMDMGYLRADDLGRIRFETLPPGLNYTITISAADYGSVIRQAEASETNTKQYDSPVVLRAADHKLAGQVLGPDSKPVAGAQVNLQGEGQPNASARTDATGHFSFAAVCEGPVTLNATYRGGRAGRVGGFINTSAQAQGGDTNVLIHLAINGPR